MVSVHIHYPVFKLDICTMFKLAPSDHIVEGEYSCARALDWFGAKISGYSWGLRFAMQAHVCFRHFCLEKVLSTLSTITTI
ncbi:hypothetical protein GQ55_9G515900 [Panicum hallii var. hallii]|uniref:Uncharacterized protein n=1 Tax=Panicum hallii var. hallii TaxID=1504633 RepID=A0A2T7CE03_9POAL|nr:hypothetical protein GQ55_9G515900 [Panicum hallii var. hallii]